jgi:hypothetical protein
MHPKPSSHSGRIVGTSYIGITSGLPVIRPQLAARVNELPPLNERGLFPRRA